MHMSSLWFYYVLNVYKNFKIINEKYNRISVFIVFLQQLHNFNDKTCECSETT